MTSTDSDFYPTDVVEDADGSLLFCDTGAWYVDACPISRVAKPQITGSIYRIRPKRSKTVSDPWGRNLDLDGLDADKLMEHLSDKRFRVRERALETIVARGKPMIPLLARALTSAPAAQTRRQVVWALYRVGSDSVAHVIREALSDSALEVSVAAIQALGELKNKGSLAALTAKLRSESPLERREAATALGRIGDRSVVNALLEATGGDIDRFEEHAIRFALIELKNRDSLREALEGHELWSARASALVALDQLKDPWVSADRVAQFLQSDDASARQTGLWVASRHPKWSHQILELVLSFLGDADSDATEEESDDPFEDSFFVEEDSGSDSSAQVIEVLKAYASNPDAQLFVAEKLTNDDFEHKELLLDVIDGAAAADLPKPWVKAVGSCLESKDDSVRDSALNVVRNRRIEALSGQLAAIADDTTLRESSRLAALAAISDTDMPIVGARLDLILDNVQSKADATNRQTAASILATATLEADTKRRLAAEYLPAADALLLTATMQVFEGESDALLGTLVIDGLLQNSNASGLMTAAKLDRLLDSFPATVHERARDFKAELDQRDAKLMERFLRLEPIAASGDVGRGRRIFLGELAACSTCHAIGSDGGTLGPDLTTIGLVRSRHDLLEAVLFPNASTVPDYQSFTVDTGDEMLSGVIGRDTAETITLHMAANLSRTVDRKDILSMEPSALSIMPEGLDAGLKDEELVDLITFLLSLNDEKWLQPEQRGVKKKPKR